MRKDYEERETNLQYAERMGDRIKSLKFMGLVGWAGLFGGLVTANKWSIYAGAITLAVSTLIQTRYEISARRAIKREEREQELIHRVHQIETRHRD